MKIEIREANPSDAGMLAELSRVTFWDAFHEHPKNAPEDMADYMSKAFAEPQIAAELADPRSLFLIAEIDGRDAGYAKLLFGYREDPVEAKFPVELCRLYSRTEFIGLGVGQALMDECLRVARGRGCDAMWLGVWEYNPRAQRFYEKQGFQIIGRHVFQLGSDPQTDNLMLVNL